ncbi:hypothetical protein VY88_04530 [Azospirillum thiophilum]|uniref:Uncharacterized protein n=2 Tax=Azospirillum thiophilum TaxID=528244 RepID=A0AAC8VWY9_9PROT|nr:hypothetical protein AL072_08175 [Azospirillum thiophilum]KJR65447.1 hypothetical protein VY88_04530 [Azospirillum thiophilum]
MGAGERMISNDRRLGDRILAALEMALEQKHLEVAEHLARALEETLTRFGGPDAVDHRQVSAGLLQAFDRLDELRRDAHRLP